jgi:3-oxoadipate enol-lactonase
MQVCSDLSSTNTRIGPAPFIAVEHAGRGPLVVFLHGVGGNKANFADQIAYFGKGRCALAWDARGYGDSDDPIETALDFASFSADLVRVLDHFDAHKACLVGVSMGGRIALDFTGRYPDRVGALVLADTSGGTTQAQDPARIEAMLATRRAPLLHEGKTPADIAPGIADSFSGPDITHGQRAALIESLSALRVTPYLATLEAVTRYTGFPAFETIKAPTLVMTGEFDPIAPPAMAQAMANSIPNAHYVCVPRAGHISNLENPAAFNHALDQFLGEHWPAESNSQ